MTPQRLKISDPRYNIREITKQMILLEQHLMEKGKYCPDCISKHLLTIEALAEEGENLDAKQEWNKMFAYIAQSAKAWSAAFATGVQPFQIGQCVRSIRKQLAPQVIAPMNMSAASDSLDAAALAAEFGAISNPSDTKLKLVLAVVAGYALAQVIRSYR